MPANTMFRTAADRGEARRAKAGVGSQYFNRVELDGGVQVAAEL